MKIKTIFMLVTICTIALSACSAPPPKPLKIVVSVPEEVDFGKQMGDAVQMAFDEVGGKVGDVPLELMIVDGGLTENKELATINSMKDDPQFVMYMGTYISSFARDVIPLTNQLHIPVLSTAATWPGLTKTGYGVGEPGIYYPTGERTFFRILPADDLQSKIINQFIRDQEYKSIYIISSEDTYSAGLVNLMLANAESTNTLIVGQTLFDINKATAEDIQAIVTGVEAAKPEVVYLSISYGEQTLAMLKALNTANPDRPIIGSGSFVGSNIGVGETSLRNVYAPFFQIPPDKTPELTAFAKRYEEKYKAVPTQWVITSYEAAKVTLDAIARAGSAPTRATVLKALHETKNYKGVMGTWSFDDNGDTDYDTFILVTLDNGEWVPFSNASD